MAMEVIAIGWTSLPVLFIGGLFLVIVLTYVLRGARRSSRNKERSAILQSMGFVEVPREQVFESAKAAGRIIEDRPTSVILSPVGKGSSDVGETVIFDFQGMQGDPDVNSRFTVVGFRVPPSIPDFEILHVLLLDRFVNKVAVENASAPSETGERKYGPFKVRPSDTPVQKRMAVESYPEFGKRYVVWTADEALMRRVLTPSLMDALVAQNDGNLRIKKGKDWLFVFRAVAKTRPASEFPALLAEAVGLASRLDLKEPALKVLQDS